METLSQEELDKLNNGFLLKQEKALLYFLKLIKLNYQDKYSDLIKSYSKEEISYIEDLINKREFYITSLSENIDPTCIKINQKAEKFIGDISKEDLKKFKITVWGV